MRFFTALAVIAFGFTLAGTGASAAESGWTTIEPGGETSCATGTPYSFHVKPGEGADAEKLLLFLNGGGACWAGDLCIPESEPSAYVPYADVPSNDPRGQKASLISSIRKTPSRPGRMSMHPIARATCISATAM